MIKNNSRGFTLAELLITVAIIGVLVAMSIPIISGQLKKARAAVDVTNVRSAKAAAVSDYLLACESNQETYYYDACHGVIKRSAEGIKVYGKSTVDLTKENIMEDYAVGVPQDGIVEIVVAAEGVQKIAWIKETSGGDEGVDIKDDFFKTVVIEPDKNEKLSIKKHQIVKLGDKYYITTKKIELESGWKDWEITQSTQASWINNSNKIFTKDDLNGNSFSGTKIKRGDIFYDNEKYYFVAQTNGVVGDPDYLWEINCK